MVVSPGRTAAASYGVVIEIADAPPTDEQTYRQLAPELIRFATALVGPSDAADVMANAFTKALASRHWSNVLNRRAYLYRAVHNEAHSHTRRRIRHRLRETSSSAQQTWELPGLRPDVRAAVLRLSVRQRAVIVLTYWIDLDPRRCRRVAGNLRGIGPPTSRTCTGRTSGRSSMPNATATDPLDDELRLHRPCPGRRGARAPRRRRRHHGQAQRR